ncbi:DUF4245 domain-containing protein [Plantactinospora sp. GCM10030261]|uniref:DUF4245 domain-containing protein n=1 Tax=Plantactinospora sp. GCM10030261 TaxID=3273420 RepID=UPI003612E5A3
MSSPAQDRPPADHGPRPPDVTTRPADGSHLDEPDRGEVVRAARKAERSPKDMAMSLLILLVPIALFIGFYRIVLGGDEPVVVDPAPAVESARAAKAFPVLDPSAPPSGWRPISAGFQRADGTATLRIGYVGPDGGGAQLVQSNAPVERLLSDELTGAARPTGAVEVGGRSWQWYTARPGERALVLLEPNRTVIVVGAVGEQELRGLVGALR